MRVKVGELANVRRLARWLPAIAWTAGVFWLSQQAKPLGMQGNEQASDAAHLALYSGLALLLTFALWQDGRCDLRWLAPFLAFALAVLYGALDEVHQGFVAGRTASNADLGVDAVGAALGVAPVLLAALGRPQRARSQRY